MNTAVSFPFYPVRAHVRRDPLERAMSLLPKDADLDEDSLGRAYLAAPYASFILDWNGRILICNRRAERLYCPENLIGPDAMRGSLFSSLTHHTTETVNEMLRVGAAQGLLTVNMKGSKSDASPISSVFRITLLRSPNRGERLYLLTQDQLKTTADALSQMNARQKKTQEAMQRLQGAHLQMSEDLLKMEVFTRAASHDLRTPISTLAGLVELFSLRFGNALPQEAQEYLAHMERAVTNMTDLTHDLLDYAKSTDASVIHEAVDLETQIEIVRSEMQQAISTADAQTSVSGPEVILQCDPNFLRILLTNLLSNALKYRHPDRPLQVEFILDDSAGGPSLAVKDNGIGFDPRLAQTIFQPFKRLETHVDGSGIGLSTCQEICRRHGWAIEATGHVGKGATFTIQF